MEIIGIIAVFGIGYVVWRVLSKIIQGADKGVHNLMHSDTYDVLEDMMGKTTIFEISTSREPVISSLLGLYPTERDKWALKQDWICQRINDDRGDYLAFVIGVVAFEWVRADSTVPITMAKLDFQDTAGGATKATFSFVMRTTPNSIGVSHVKHMAELIGILKDTFMEVDPSCKISEGKYEAKS